MHGGYAWGWLAHSQQAASDAREGLVGVHPQVSVRYVALFPFPSPPSFFLVSTPVSCPLSFCCWYQHVGHISSTVTAQPTHSPVSSAG